MKEVVKPEQVRHWSGSGPVQVEQVEWQATHSADDVERYNLGMETNQSMWNKNGFKMESNGIKMDSMVQPGDGEH